MRAMNLHSYGKSIQIVLRNIMLMVCMLLAGWLNEVSGQAANLDQGANGKSTAPDSPVDWINGNLNANQAHFLEGYSVPYRAILTGLTVNQNYTLVIALDVKNSGKHALDYITHFQRLEPHGIFLHAAETVNPLLNITGFPPAYFTSTDTEPIPVPSSAGSPVPGQPSASFNALPAAERVMTGYNADLLSVTYASHGSLTASQSETVINITFKALKETAVLSWGGHIAREADWGSDPITGETNSASAINGSPYHMRLKNWIINGEVVSIGNQDRSLKTDAVFIPPTCEVSGPQEACVSTTSLAFTSTVDNATGLTYLWSIIGSNTAGAKIVNNTLANISVVPIGATFTPGTFNLRLIVTRNGLSDTCYSGSHEAPGLPVTIYQPVVDAGADVSITHLDIASLNATVIGGKSPYTFSWSPATGLSDPNVHNPTFTPPSTGIFQFVVTVTDAAGCTDKDTVVITVTQHADPPCVIDGPDPVCPGSSNVYTGPDPSLVSFFQWSVTGNGTITGDTDKGTVTILAGNTCGPYTIQLITATPDGKVKDTCTRVVQVQDNEKPVLHGSAPDATLGCGKDVPAAPVITATDNCVANITAQMSSTTFDSTCINKFRIVRKWWATDACGNTSDTLTQVITVNDDVKPVISGTYEETVNVSCVGDIPAPPALTANDNCDGLLQPNYTEQGSGSACDSTIVRTWVFTDACGNSASATQTIHLKDAIAPTLVGTAQDANVACSKDIPTPPVITANDNCPAEVKVNFTSTTYDSTCVNKFRIVRKWWAVDGCGNTSDVLTQTIVVNDNVKPVITASYEDKIEVKCVGDIPQVPAISAYDNCDGELQPQYSEQGSGTACDSTIVRTWVFTDGCGNTASATQTIHLQDLVPPTLNGTAQNVNVTCSKDIPAPPVITASDNCPAEVKLHFTENTYDSICVNKFRLERTWWAVDGCGNTSEVLTQTIIVNDDVKPIISGTYDETVNVVCVGDIPAPPSITATDNCAGVLQPDYSEEGSGTACDSTIVRTWVFTDGCGNTVTATQTIHLKDLVKPVLNGTAPDATVQCAKDVPAPPAIKATDNCGTAKVYYSETKKNVVCVNRFVLVRKWWAKDNCGNTSDTLYQKVTVYDNTIPVVTNKPADKTLPCGSQPSFNPPSFSDNCGGYVTVVVADRQEGTSCPVTYIRRWTGTDACGNSVWVEQRVRVLCCASYCTYTQGYYGNVNGKACLPGGGTTTAKAIMLGAVDAQPGDSVLFGLKATGKFFTLFLMDVSNDNIFKMLPGGGTPAALKGYTTYSKPATWPLVPISTAASKYGKINNVLLSQTMTLFFNFRVTPGLTGLPIQGTLLMTSKLTACGSTIPVAKVDSFELPKSVVNYLTSIGQSNVGGLFNLANKYLGGQTVTGVTASDVNAAVDAINRGFDKCAVLIGWSNAKLNCAPQVMATGTDDEKMMTIEPETNILSVETYPNPYRDVVMFRFTAPVTGTLQLLIYNLGGQQVDALNKGTVQKGSVHQIRYAVPDAHRSTLIYKLSVGRAEATGKLIYIKH